MSTRGDELRRAARGQKQPPAWLISPMSNRPDSLMIVTTKVDVQAPPAAVMATFPPDPEGRAS